MASSDQAVTSQSSQLLAGSHVKPQPATIVDLISNRLPPELWLEIHRLLLDDLDITTVSEPHHLYSWETPASERVFEIFETAKLCTLDPATLSIIKYYEGLFAISPQHKPLIWEHHVRFVFPSLLAMGDVFTAYQAAGRLHQMRRVKVFSKRILVSHNHTSLCIHVETVLDVFPELKLDHLECLDQHPLMCNRSSAPQRIEVPRFIIRILASPGWRRLTILGAQHHFGGHVVECLIAESKVIAQTDRADEYILDLPDTPTIKNGSEIMGLDTDRYPKHAKQIHRDYHGYNADDLSLSGLEDSLVCPQIVLTRKQYGVRKSHPPRGGDVENLMRKWIQGDGSNWHRRRKPGDILPGFRSTDL